MNASSLAAPVPEPQPGSKVSEDTRRSIQKSAQDAHWRVYLARICDGEQTALGSLYDESSSLVYSMVLRVLGNVADAEEVTMDVYTQVWKSASGYDTSRGSVTAWLITLARSRAI